MKPLSFISGANPEYIEQLYREYRKDPESIDEEWSKFFEGFDFAITENNLPGDESFSAKELQVYQLIEAYRQKAHLLSDTNPIRERKDRHPHLSLEDFHLGESDLDHHFSIGNVLGLENPTLEEIIDFLNRTYISHFGIEYKYITEPGELEFFKQRIEEKSKSDFTLEEKKHIFQKLNQATIFEKFLHTKYIGQKRFSLEGGENTISALDAIIHKGAENGVSEIVMGMAHRGRLNVLVNILGKTYAQVFNEFEGTANPDLTMGDGDVKYHLGYSAQIETRNGNMVDIKLAPNPSHLEAVDPVVQGFTRAKADILYQSNYNCVMPILIHGDAALAGQGVVYEVLQMSQLKGYYIGGTIHFVINNQIGFTTDFDDARSSDYCTSLAATIKAPVIHVNGDDAEAVVWAAELATEYRTRFHKDIFIDMLCYRKHGHNESDEPKFTQPNLYALISKHPTPREVYKEKLISEGEMTAQLAKSMDKEFWDELGNALDMVKEEPLPYQYQEPEIAWQQLRKSNPEDFVKSPKTAVSKKLIDKAIKGLIKVPDGFTPLRKVQKMLEQRREMFFESKKLDWASGELLAYGTLLLEGHDIRMSGQDTKRGTFSHRHAVIYDEKTSEEYNRLDNLTSDQKGRFRIYNSLLSEFAVLGFEYGYSTASPDSLTLWEAQFGDFANGAQSITDQFIVSGESKWRRMSGLVMLLPHGYEGQGPEHSSARLERFLQASAEFNIAVVNITTPANFFHALRRQLAWPFRKPLVVMSPKSLLRHPKCVSDIKEFLEGGFQEIIVDDFAKKPADVKKVIFCSGKIYYDLLERQELFLRTDVVIVRLEQLYPLPFKQIDALMKKYAGARKIWLQEEPANMGAWVYLLSCYRSVNWEVISRKASASPASGYHKVHEREQDDILDMALGDNARMQNKTDDPEENGQQKKASKKTKKEPASAGK